MCLWCDVCACDLKVDALQSLDSYLPERLANALLKRSRKSIRNILIFISDWGKIASFQYKKNNVILIVMGMAIPVWKWNLKSRPLFGKYNFQTLLKSKVPMLKIELLIKKLTQDFLSRHYFS